LAAANKSELGAGGRYGLILTMRNSFITLLEIAAVTDDNYKLFGGKALGTLGVVKIQATEVLSI